jgi:hypothetical protein
MQQYWPSILSLETSSLIRLRSGVQFLAPVENLFRDST